MRLPALTLLALTLAISAAALPTAGVTVINNRDYYPAVMTLIASAEDSIAVAMYQTRFYEEYPGSHSNNLCDALIAAAQRGVQVTFLVDLEDSDWNRNNEQNADFARRLAEGGCAVYYDDGNQVSHTKLLVVDGVASVISSVNWSHYALTNNNEVGVIVWGPEVAEACHAYVAAEVEKGRLQTEGRTLPPFAAAAEDVPAYAAARGFNLLPCEEAELLVGDDYYPAVKALIDSATQRVTVVQRSAVFYRMRPAHADAPAPGQAAISLTNALLADLVSAEQRGVEVAMVLEGGVAYEEGQTRTNDNLDFGLRARSRGIDIWWDSPDAQTHAKMLLVDDAVVVGSTNWTLFAVEGQNREMSVLLRSPAVAQVYADYVAALQAAGERFTGEF